MCDMQKLLPLCTCFLFSTRRYICVFTTICCSLQQSAASIYGLFFLKRKSHYVFFVWLYGSLNSIYGLTDLCLMTEWFCEDTWFLYWITGILLLRLSVTAYSSNLHLNILISINNCCVLSLNSVSSWPHSLEKLILNGAVESFCCLNNNCH